MSWWSRHPSPAVALGALSVSASSVLIDLSGGSPGTVTFYRCVLALPALAALFVWERRVEGPPPGRQYLLATMAGVLFAGDMMLWAQAIFEVGAGISTVLVNAQVVLVPLLAWIVDHEPVTRLFLMLLPVMIIGIVLTGGLIGGSPTGTNPWWGSLHAVLAAVCYSLYLFLLRRGGQEGHIRQTYLVVIMSAALVSLVAGVLWYDLDFTPGWATIGWLLGVTVCSQLVGWLLVALYAHRLPSHVGAVLLLLTPVGAVVLGAVVLAERPTPLQLVGCALILGTAYLATVRGTHQDQRS